MPKKTPSPLERAAARLKDPDEVAWRAEVERVDETNQRIHDRRQDFMRRRSDALRAGRKAPKAPPAGEVTYEPWPPPLPDFNVGRPAHVKRELLGRFLLDRDTAIVHDCHAARPACAIDEIANGTFIHFAGEITTAAADARPCEHCLSEEA